MEATGLLFGVVALAFAINAFRSIRDLRIQLNDQRTDNRELKARLEHVEAQLKSKKEKK